MIFQITFGYLSSATKISGSVIDENANHELSDGRYYDKFYHKTQNNLLRMDEKPFKIYSRAIFKDKK